MREDGVEAFEELVQGALEPTQAVLVYVLQTLLQRVARRDHAVGVGLQVLAVLLHEAGERTHQLLGASLARRHGGARHVQRRLSVTAGGELD